ncbi:MAG: site-2 protease family protein [Planctomycetota bacterium]|nr:site-2 protease family protein [Planctomycetota bacterium]
MDFSLVALFSASSLATFLAILKALVALGFVIFVHELGHFLVAKACGVKCEKFYVGFDIPIRIWRLRLPSALVKVQWGETEYGIGIVPLGGYVKMLGQDDNPLNAEAEAERARKSPDEDAAEVDKNEVEEKDAVAAEEPVEVEKNEGTGTTIAAVNSVSPLLVRNESVELDPRSYVAKNVPQRMAIISAGVIMNLIFAVIFAAVAYRMGVKITPCVVAGTSAGDPAWQQAWPSGSQIVQIGRDGDPDSDLRFQWELRYKVAESGIGENVKEMDILLRAPDGQEQWKKITPTDRLKQQLGMVSLGIRPPSSSRLSGTVPFYRGSAAAEASPPLEPGDLITAVDGIPLAGAGSPNTYYGHHLLEQLAAAIDSPMTLTVQRTGIDGSTETVEVDLAPAPFYSLGLEMKIGPLVAIQQGSVASAVGFQAGDELVTFNGEPIGDPLTLSQRVGTLAGEPLEFTVTREGSTVAIDVPPLGPELNIPYMGPLPVASIESLGIAFEVTSQVTGVQPESSAGEKEVAVGSEVVSVQLRVRGEANKAYVAGNYGERYEEEMVIGQQGVNWMSIHHRLQHLLPDTEVMVKLQHADSAPVVVSLAARPRAETYFSDRGLVLTQMHRQHTAASWGDAISLGFRETREKLSEVLRVLKMLVTREVSVDKLGGPITIVRVMGIESSEGFSRLLLFLTFLSANLAILNFLPIPALDGGHMIFLLVEAVTRRPVSERIQGIFTLIGVVLLLALMIYVIFNDIARI